MCSLQHWDYISLWASWNEGPLHAESWCVGQIRLSCSLYGNERSFTFLNSLKLLLISECLNDL